MQAAPVPDTATVQAWWTLWHEPWLDAHPAWWAMNDSAAGPVMTRFRQPAPGARLAYRWFCRHFGIDAGRPFPQAHGAELPALPLAPDQLVAAATALGRVGYASHCLRSSRQGLARLFSHETQTGGSAAAWRDALRQARARPLTVAQDHAPPPDGTALQLQRWALPLMARLLEDAVPGAWARLRLRFDPACFSLAPLAPVSYPLALQPQAWRIWRAAALDDPQLTAYETDTD